VSELKPNSVVVPHKGYLEDEHEYEQRRNAITKRHFDESVVDVVGVERLAAIVEQVANEWPSVSRGRLSESVELRGIVMRMRSLIDPRAGVYVQYPETTDMTEVNSDEEDHATNSNG